MDRILDSERLAQMGRELRQELASSDEVAGDWDRRAARVMAEQMLSAEVEEALGRGSYQRRADDGQAGYRNGYKARSIRTAEGRVAVDVPQVRGRDEPYRSAVWRALGKRSPALEKLAVEMYARGLSTRDIEDLLKELSDEQEQTLLSKSAVSRVTEVLWEEFEAFARRDLSGFDVVYLFCDAVYESLRQQAGCRQAILVTWAICSDGSKVLLHLSLGNKESGDAWLEHLRSVVLLRQHLPAEPPEAVPVREQVRRVRLPHAVHQRVPHPLHRLPHQVLHLAQLRPQVGVGPQLRRDRLFLRQVDPFDRPASHLPYSLP